MNDEADNIERSEAARALADMTRRMFNEFIAQGFSEAQALALVRSWISGIAQGQAGA